MALTIVHFCVESFDPRLGGMEESAARIARRLDGVSGIKIIGYTLRTQQGLPPPIPDCVGIDTRVGSLVESLGLRSEHLSSGQRTRAQIFFLREAVGKRLRDFPNDCHVMMSFYLPTAGFVTQHVACDFQIPHVACSRGSDLGHGLFMHDKFAAIEFVVNRATQLVTTNREHKRMIRNVCGRDQGVATIYNSFSGAIEPKWKPHRRERVKMVCVGGYCIKKGTHLLLEAAARLLDEGEPIELAIVGPTRLGAWDSVRERYQARYSPHIHLGDWVSQAELKNFLMDGDIFCSASLSEGCSNATLLALGMGMPVVSTRTGALPDLARDWPQVELVEPGNVAELARGLSKMVKKLQSRRLMVDKDRIRNLISELSMETEQRRWGDLLVQTAEYYCPRSDICRESDHVHVLNLDEREP